MHVEWSYNSLTNLGVVLQPVCMTVFLGGKSQMSVCVLMDTWVLLCIVIVVTVHVFGVGFILWVGVIYGPLATNYQESHSDLVECT